MHSVQFIFAILAIVCFGVAALFDSPPYTRAIPLGLLFLTVALCLS